MASFPASWEGKPSLQQGLKSEGRGTAHSFPNELSLVPESSEVWLTWGLWFSFMPKSHPSQDLIAIAWGDLSLPSSTLSQLGVLSTSFPLKKKIKMNSFLPLSSWSIPLQGQRRTEVARERKREHSPEREEMQEQHCPIAPSSKYMFPKDAWCLGQWKGAQHKKLSANTEWCTRYELYQKQHRQ